MDNDEKELLAGLFNGANLEHAQIVVIAKDNAKIVYKDNGGEQKPTKPDYNDDVIMRALLAINGKGKALCEKQLFLGVTNVLKYKCGWAGKLKNQCDKVNTLPMAGKLEVQCDYNNVKAVGALKFAALKYTEWADYDPTNIEREVFYKVKAVADEFDQELDRQLSLD